MHQPITRLVISAVLRQCEKKQTMTHTNHTHDAHKPHTRTHTVLTHTRHSALPKLGVLPLVPLKTLEESVTRAKQTILSTSGEMQSPDSLLVRFTDNAGRRTQTTHIETQEPTTEEDRSTEQIGSEKALFLKSLFYT